MGVVNDVALDKATVDDVSRSLCMLAGRLHATCTTHLIRVLIGTLIGVLLAVRPGSRPQLLQGYLRLHD
jgi:hypothetical protein